jgi:serralysin
MVAATPPPQSPPAMIVVERLGRPSFEEDFSTFDAGPDQGGAGRPHRWRTVLGAGGPQAFANRSFGGDVVFVDPAFPGIDDAGRFGAAPLRLQPFSLSPGGGLSIIARRADQNVRNLLWHKSWYSGVISTKFSYSSPSGYWEVTADLPLCTHGAWAGIWLMSLTGVWPNGGEIDAPETIGDGRLHYALHSGVESRAAKAWSPPTGCQRGMHRYGILTSKSYVAFYYDGALLSAEPPPADYGKPMYLLIDLAMGGSWAGPPNAALQSEHLTVKSVSVWRDAAPAS